MLIITHFKRRGMLHFTSKILYFIIIWQALGRNPEGYGWNVTLGTDRLIVFAHEIIHFLYIINKWIWGIQYSAIDENCQYVNLTCGDRINPVQHS